MRSAVTVMKRTLVSFYDDQMTQHAAALTYYALMSLFPAICSASRCSGLMGEYPSTYNAIMTTCATSCPTPRSCRSTLFAHAFRHKDRP